MSVSASTANENRTMSGIPGNISVASIGATGGNDKVFLASELNMERFSSTGDYQGHVPGPTFPQSDSLTLNNFVTCFKRSDKRTPIGSDRHLCEAAQTIDDYGKPYEYIWVNNSRHCATSTNDNSG